MKKKNWKFYSGTSERGTVIKIKNKTLSMVLIFSGSIAM